MIFQKVEAEQGKENLEIKIDGEAHVVPVPVNLDHFNCRESFLNIIRRIEEGCDEDDPINVDNLASWKKELLKELKEFEKKYVKHAKSSNPVLAKI